MRRAPAAVALAAALLAASPALGERAVPALAGPVVDEAGLLSPREVGALESLSRAAHAQGGGTGVQLQYLVVPSLEGEPIESFSVRVAEAWKLGSAKEDNGVLVVVARDDRAVRIEVGGGIEGGLTDAQAGRIIRDTIVPAFRAGRYGEGLYQAGQQILAALGALPQGMAARRSDRDVRAVPASCGGGLFTLLVVGLVLMSLFSRIAGFGPRRRRRFGGFWGGPFGGGGFGGGGGWGGGGFGGGGGGWGGGGGGFSGGGASGRW
jgi:uncharacterized protein